MTLKTVFGLAYVLISSYVIVRLGTDWWLAGVWDLNLELAANVLAVSLLQLLVMALFLRLSPVPVSNPEYASGQETANRQPGIKRFLLIWFALFISFVLATVLTSVFLFKHIDIRYARYFQLMAIPLFQSLVLIWVISPSPMPSLKLAFRQVFSYPGITGLLLSAIGLLMVGIVFPLHDYLGILGAKSIVPALTGLQLAIAGIVALTLYRYESYGFLDKAWVALFSCLSLAIAADTVLPWIDNIPLLGKSFTLMFIQANFTTLFFFIVALIVLVKIGQLLRRRCAAAGLLLDVAVLILFLVAHMFVLDLYQPYSTPFAQSVIRMGMAFASTCILAGIVLNMLTARSSRTSS